MPTDFTIPRIDVPIGRTDKGALVYFDANFLRAFFQKLSDRIGGNVALSNTELAAMLDETNAEALTIRSDPAAQDASRGVDELRSEIASVRSDCDNLRRLLDEREAEFASLRSTTDLRQRVEQLEDRLA